MQSATAKQQEQAGSANPASTQRAYRRTIDCSPPNLTPGPEHPSTGRGRGTPDPERWDREPSPYRD